MDLKILLIAVFMTSTIVFAFKAHKYKVLSKVLDEFYSEKLGRIVSEEEIREWAKDKIWRG